jgi:hypothetical protein
LILRLMKTLELGFIGMVNVTPRVTVNNVIVDVVVDSCVSALWWCLWCAVYASELYKMLARAHKKNIVSY